MLAMRPIGQIHPLNEKIHTDPDTGALVHRFVHRKPSLEQLFYYCSPGMTDDGRFIPCWSNVSGCWEIHAIDRQEKVSIQLSNRQSLPGDSGEFPADHPCLSPERNRVFYHDAGTLYWADIQGREQGWLLQAPEGYRFLSLSARGRYLAFSYTERMALPVLPPGRAMHSRPQLHYKPRTVIVAVDLDTGDGEYAWGGHAYLGHVEMCPFDDQRILFVDQSNCEHQQEVFVVDREFADDKQAFKVLAGNFPDYRGRTKDYIGHCFFTRDGWIAGQYVEMGNVDARGTYTDRSEFNLVIRPDGTGKRKAKFPGHRKPCHVHAQDAGGLWVGDHWIKPDGTVEMGWLSVIVNDFTAQELVSYPLARTNHCWQRPFHVHPWIGPAEDIVVCAYNTGAAAENPYKGRWDDNHIALIELPPSLRRRQVPPTPPPPRMR